jgi:hypothetical protein
LHQGLTVYGLFSVCFLGASFSTPNLKAILSYVQGFESSPEVRSAFEGDLGREELQKTTTLISFTALDSRIAFWSDNIPQHHLDQPVDNSRVSSLNPQLYAPQLVDPSSGFAFGTTSGDAMPTWRQSSATELYSTRRGKHFLEE